MAYVQDQTDQQQQQTNTPMSQAPQTSSGAGAGAAVSGAVGSGGQGAASVPNSTQAPPVQNLQAYLTANAPQAVQMGQNIGNSLSTQANQVTGDINADQAATDQQIQAQNVAPNQSLINSAASNPSAFVQDPNNVAAFQQQENASYGGPSTYESTPDYTALQNEVTNAQNNAPDINKPGGIQQLVTGQEQNPTVGEENLDTLLLQENPDALAPINSALSQYPNLGSALSNSATTEDQAIQQAIGNDQADQQNVQSTFLTGPNAVAPTFENSLNNQVQSDQSAENAYNSTVNNNISELNPLNSNFNSFETTAGLTGLTNPLSSYLSQTPMTGTPTLANASSAGQYAEDAALAQLLGTGYAPELNQANAGQAGTFNVPTATAANLQNLSQQVGDVATQGLFSQKAIPQVNSFDSGYNNFMTINGRQGVATPSGAELDELNQLDNEHFLSDQSAINSALKDTTPASESNFLAQGQPGSFANGVVHWNQTNPTSTGYNSLLQYLASVNPSGVTKDSDGNYQVNS